jgi:hypothetical protein
MTRLLTIAVPADLSLKEIQEYLDVKVDDRRLSLLRIDMTDGRPFATYDLGLEPIAIYDLNFEPIAMPSPVKAKSRDTKAEAVARGVLQYEGVIKPSEENVKSFIVENSYGIKRALEFVKPVVGQFSVEKVFATAAFIFADINPELAEEFMDRLGTGRGISTGHPIFKLREQYFKNGVPKTTSAKHLNRDLTPILKTWEAWRDSVEKTPTSLFQAVGDLH